MSVMKITSKFFKDREIKIFLPEIYIMNKGTSTQRFEYALHVANPLSGEDCSNQRYLEFESHKCDMNDRIKKVSVKNFAIKPSYGHIFRENT